MPSSLYIITVMKFKVHTVRRQGVVKPRYSWNETAVTGHLRVEEQFSHEFHRNTLVARLIDDAGHPLPGIDPLYDAVLMSVKCGAWSMRGIERYEKFPGQWADFAQTWVMAPVGEIAG